MPKTNENMKDESLLISEILKKTEKKPDDSIKNEVWNNIKNYYNNFKPKRLYSKYYIRKWYNAAAFIAGIVIGLSIFFMSDNIKTISYKTDYGQIKKYILPDGSSVFLNANSRLTIPKNWDKIDVREAWIVGEAFFNVKKVSNSYPKKFIVHANKIELEILGTSFNVLNRKNKTKIVLNSGKIKLNTTIENNEEITMSPGDLIEYSYQKNTIIQKKVKPEHYSSWTKGKLIFDNITLKEIAEIVEDNFGVEMEIEASLKERRMRGAVPSDSIEILLETLSKALNVDIIISKNEVKIMHKI